MNDRPDASQDQKQEASERHRNPSLIEWVVGGLSTALVLSGIGFLIYEALHGTSLPPMVSVEVRQILPQPAGGYVVEIVAANRGGITARGLTIRGRLLAGAEEVETATTTLSWVPAHAEREGGLFFRRDPREHRLEVDPQGYDRP